MESTMSEARSGQLPFRPATDPAGLATPAPLPSPSRAGWAAALAYALWLRGLGFGPAASLGWATAGIFCTPSWFYGTSTFDDILGTTTVVAAVATAFLLKERRPVLGAVLAGLLMGWAVNCKEP